MRFLLVSTLFFLLLGGGIEFLGRRDGPLIQLLDWRAQVSTLQHQLDNTKEQLQASKNEISTLKEWSDFRFSQADIKSSNLELKVLLLELQSGAYNVGSLDPASTSKFTRVDTAFGPLLVSLRDVRPYADGVKLDLDFGNLTAGNISDVEVRAKWGPRRIENKSPDQTAEAKEQREKWEKSLKEEKFTLMTTLRSGTWEPITLTLPATKMEDLGYFSFSVDATTIGLSRPRSFGN